MKSLQLPARQPLRPRSLLNRRADGSEARLRRLQGAIEAGVADRDDPALKDRIAGLKAMRDRAKVVPMRMHCLPTLPPLSRRIDP
ncbi:hypothetical protein [Ancylobacter amanitiformis]|uniref:Uncharacterized protein n=1 Tax=Ancylobacter amanitiformis TaxID=217069 RepID=A0ABU0LXS4_9HYPH|nr:hypothetical protein [Ancylobacter amanitiformis]MDQ0513403.1 hypothetical protein [Ancylobacter amanitiformis]